MAMGSHPEVDAISIAHPGGIEYPSDFEKCIRPVLALCPGFDPIFPNKERDGEQQILEEKGTWNKFVIFKGSQHGFAV
jgi:dienelactone hydrolase